MLNLVVDEGYLWARVRLGYVALREGNLSRGTPVF